MQCLVPAGYRGEAGEIWLARLLPTIDVEGTTDAAPLDEEPAEEELEPVGAPVG